MDVVVAEDQLSLAIGKRGQNVRLAAKLTGWRLDIKSEAKLEEELTDVKGLLAAIEGISWDMSGFTSRGEAESMVNILRDIALTNMSILKDEKQQTFMKNA